MLKHILLKSSLWKKKGKKKNHVRNKSNHQKNLKRTFVEQTYLKTCDSQLELLIRTFVSREK